MKKVAVIGAGNVGASAAQRIAEAELADVIMVDVIEGMPQGKALDLQESAPLVGHDANIYGTNDYADLAGSDLVIMTAGVARKPGMDRMDLLKVNAEIVRNAMREVVRHASDAIVIMVTNPLDVTTHIAYEVTGFGDKRVVGMAGVLDSARFRTFIALELGVSMEDVQAMVLGGHGDQMVPLPRFSTVSGIPITELLTQEVIDRLVERTRKGGGEIVALLKTGSAYYAPAAGIFQMAESIIKDKKRILPCSVRLNGEYGLSDVFVGVPVKLGAQGVEEIIELKLTAQEQSDLRHSAEIVKKAVEELKQVA